MILVETYNGDEDDEMWRFWRASRTLITCATSDPDSDKNCTTGSIKTAYLLSNVLTRWQKKVSMIKLLPTFSSSLWVVGEEDRCFHKESCFCWTPITFPLPPRTHLTPNLHGSQVSPHYGKITEFLCFMCLISGKRKVRLRSFVNPPFLGHVLGLVLRNLNCTKSMIF